MGAGRSNLMITSRGAGSSRSSSQDGVPVSSFHVPLQSSRHAALAASVRSMARSHHNRIVAFEHQQPLALEGSHVDALVDRDFDARPRRSQQISIQTSSSFPFAFTRNFPVGW
jgi:hypothetical protein